MKAREIVVDNFAGGGGASCGIEAAIGRSVDIAINHDPVAVAMHKANHPDTEHYCENVWNVNPREAAKGRPVALCWLSPDCRHHSRAKGGKPLDKNIRGLAWVAVRWAGTVRPRVIILENVSEFLDWGPLLNGKPCPKRKGHTFRAFVNALKRQGYEVEWRELRACDYGAPTSRKRFFLIARCDGRPIVWPRPTHGDSRSEEVRSGKLLPWRTAAEIIDWTLPCPSIFERKKPLAKNTLRRVARGVQRFVLRSPQPFIIKVNHKYEQFRGQNLNEPFQTITSRNGWGIVAPVIARQFGKSVGHAVDKPLGTVTAGGSGKSQLVTASLAQYHSEKSEHEVRGQTLDRPILTLDTSNRYALATSHLVKLRGTCRHGQTVTRPVPTVTAGGRHIGEVRAFLLKYYNSNIGHSCGEPLQTVTTKHRFAVGTTDLATPPLSDEQLYNAWWCARLLEEFGADQKRRRSLMPEQRDSFVQLGEYILVDIGMRMLEPHELFAAQGFPANYIHERDYEGNRLSKVEQVAKCGNAVPPPFAEHLVRANLPELCAGTESAEQVV